MKIIDARVRLRTEQLLKAWTTELKPFLDQCNVDISPVILPPRTTERAKQGLFVVYIRLREVKIRVFMRAGDRAPQLQVKSPNMLFKLNLRL